MQASGRFRCGQFNRRRGATSFISLCTRQTTFPLLYLAFLLLLDRICLTRNLLLTMSGNLLSLAGWTFLPNVYIVAPPPSDSQTDNMADGDGMAPELLLQYHYTCRRS
jgi:hypothetical protein